jgi:hypothetical protein
MTSALKNLCGPGKPLRREAPDQAEFDGLLRSGKVRLKDAQNTQNAIESRFDLAYNAAHALCLAALRQLGFRAQHRYIVFHAHPRPWPRDLARARQMPPPAQPRGV